MVKKVCLMTGATSGLGKCISLKLFSKGYKLILVSKSKSKLDELRNIIGANNIKYFCVDLSNLQETKRFLNKISSIDILINNAGGFYFKKEKNIRKFNRTLVLNYYTPYLLIHKMLNKKKNKKLVINISSKALIRSNINISEIKNLDKYNGWEIYKFSKLLLILITNYLSQIHREIKFVSVDPGRMVTNFGSNNFFLIRVLIKLYLKILGKSPNLVANEIITLIKKDRLNSKFKIKKKILLIFLLKILKKDLFIHINKLLKNDEKKTRV